MTIVKFDPKKERIPRTGDRHFRAGLHSIRLKPGENALDPAAVKAVSKHPIWLGLVECGAIVVVAPARKRKPSQPKQEPPVEVKVSDNEPINTPEKVSPV